MLAGGSDRQPAAFGLMNLDFSKLAGRVFNQKQASHKRPPVSQAVSTDVTPTGTKSKWGMFK